MSAPISGSSGPRRKPTKCQKCSEEFPNVELRQLHLCQNRKYKKQATGDSRDNHEKAGKDSVDDIQIVSIRGDTNFIRQAINQEKVNIKEEIDHTSNSNMEISSENNNESNNNFNERLNSSINPSVDKVFKSEIDLEKDIPNRETELQSNSIRMSHVSDWSTQDYAYVKEEIVIQDDLENVRRNLGQSSSTRPDLQTTRTDRSRETTLEDGGNNNVSGTTNPETVKISMDVEMSATLFVRVAQHVFGGVNVQQTNGEEQSGEDGDIPQNVMQEVIAQKNVVEEVNGQQTVVEEDNEQQTHRGRKRSRTQ